MSDGSEWCHKNAYTQTPNRLGTPPMLATDGRLCPCFLEMRITASTIIIPNAPNK
ncbi:hypothetical protein DPMN_033078 [Dreissena polymorpha]|uniref:Uncharacterized protein n=1 Tax=Dreissena polymorpha TaxID=45954 RepID=A0A9D4M5Z4_DREPO|nr:hypothetical protein DPMN_033078 [Dreissena polymorpha]